MRKFAIVTDSASDINPETARKMGVHVVPMHINMGGDDRRDGVDVQIGWYLDILEESKDLPRTSMPSPGDFVETYRSIVADGCTDILSIHLSRALSSTVETPRLLASTMFSDIRIEVVDSGVATVAQGAMVLEAAAIAASGGTIEEALARVFAIRNSVRIQFTPESLANLVKGGRATAFQALAASALNVKPVIGFNDRGELQVFRKARGIRRAVGYMADVLADQERERGRLFYFTLHTKAERGLECLSTAIRERGLGAELGGCATIGPCIATHVGRGAVGVMSYPFSLHSPMLRGEEMFLSI